MFLEDELEITHKNTELLHLRFGKALLFKRHFNGALEKSYLIPPTSVFVALENAVKHNEISELHPLQVDIDLKEDHLIISNRIRETRNLQHSSRIGLRNLDERFRLVTGKNILSGKNEDNFFKVQLPLIPLKS